MAGPRDVDTELSVRGSTVSLAGQWAWEHTCVLAVAGTAAGEWEHSRIPRDELAGGDGDLQEASAPLLLSHLTGKPAFSSMRRWR